MSGNSATGGYRKRTWDYYHAKLPRRLRLALAHAVFEWDDKWFYDKWNNGKSVDWCIAELKKWDTKECTAPWVDKKIKRFYAKRGNPTKTHGVRPLRIDAT